MTAKALLAALVVAVACTQFALAADSYSVSTNGDNTSVSVSDGNSSMADGQWSGRWINNEWTPGYWQGGTWNKATWNTDTNDWTVTVKGQDYTMTGSDWDA